MQSSPIWKVLTSKTKTKELLLTFEELIFFITSTLLYK